MIYPPYHSKIESSEEKYIRNNPSSAYKYKLYQPNRQPATNPVLLALIVCAHLLLALS